MHRDIIKNNISKILLGLTIVFLAVIFLSNNMKSFAAWKVAEDGRLYYENENGGIVTGFYEIDGKQYHFNKEGYLDTGKFYDETNCAYYFSDDEGVVQIGTIVTDDGFYLTEDDGRIITGFVEYNGKRYFFSKAADAVVGWFKDGDNWYYGGYQGEVMTGFIEYKGYRYYLDDNGIRVADTTMEIDGVNYVFNSDGSVDENATLLYDVARYIERKRSLRENLNPLTTNSMVQSCAVMRASELKDGYYKSSEDMTMENLLKNRGVMCKGGYELSYGGVPGFDIDNLLDTLDKDSNINDILYNPEVKEYGLGVYSENDILYFDFIFIK